MQRILVSLSIIGVVAAFVIGGTVAYFHDVEVAGENIFQVGTLDLRLRDDYPGHWADGARLTWETPDNWAPGEIEEGTLSLRNAGNIDAAELRVTFENDFDNFTAEDANSAGVESFDGEYGDHEHDMSREMIVVYWMYGDINLLAITDGGFDNDWVEAADEGHINDNIITLYDLERHSRVAPLSLSGIAGGVEIDWTMNIKFDVDAPNALQGDKLTMEIEFNLRQFKAIR